MQEGAVEWGCQCSLPGLRRVGQCAVLRCIACGSCGSHASGPCILDRDPGASVRCCAVLGLLACAKARRVVLLLLWPLRFRFFGLVIPPFFGRFGRLISQSGVQMAVVPYLPIYLAVQSCGFAARRVVVSTYREQSADPPPPIPICFSCRGIHDAV